MCVETEYLTIVGPLDDLEAVIGHWTSLPTVERLLLPAPQITRLGGLGSEFRGGDTPHVATVRNVLGPSIAHRLQVDIATTMPQQRVVCEPGVDFSPAAADGWVERPQIELFVPSWIDLAKDFSRSVQASENRARGKRIAVIDTGDVAGSSADLSIYDGVVRSANVGDPTGHGSAVRQIIRTVRADVETSKPR
jgi:hypothetical protein